MPDADLIDLRARVDGMVGPNRRREERERAVHSAVDTLVGRLSRELDQVRLTAMSAGLVASTVQGGDSPYLRWCQFPDERGDESVMHTSTISFMTAVDGFSKALWVGIAFAVYGPDAVAFKAAHILTGSSRDGALACFEGSGALGSLELEALAVNAVRELQLCAADVVRRYLDEVEPPDEWREQCPDRS